ncbi:T9SS type A sorting domain-containing protein [Pontibacter qinzhouensis]|uniref:T9SS type A sorting domain-containing protein n=1 Tax=Pontibacter qinzhouensis TaxID=2603253 RepID=A0A5C8KD59_9BACT|nr:MBG domain-containing protein [Pontibacter qinzhouensis]TXK52864.1 T9SS type A sorting domain-containing protein [Pontibacter qinzhouensis]
MSFGPVSEKTFGDAPFLPAATSSSGLPVSFAVFSGPAAVVEGAAGNMLLDVTGTGTVVVLAYQAGDGVYEPAPAVMQSFVVKKKQLTVTAEDKSREYQQPDPLFTLAYKGFVKGQDATYLQEQPEVTTEATLQSNAGKYPLLVTGGADSNYELHYVTGTLTIIKQKALVSLSGLWHEHTGKAIEATVNTSPEGLQVQVTYNGKTNPPAAAGSYLVEATILETNYEGAASDSLFIWGVNMPAPDPEPEPTPEPETEQEVELFPNPSDNGKIVIKLEPAFQGALVEVCTLSGGVVMSFRLNDDETQHLDFSALQKGLYLIRFVGPTGVYKTIKFYRL